MSWVSFTSYHAMTRALPVKLNWRDVCWGPPASMIPPAGGESVFSQASKTVQRMCDLSLLLLLKFPRRRIFFCFFSVNAIQRIIVFGFPCRAFVYNHVESLLSDNWQAAPAWIALEYLISSQNGSTPNKTQWNSLTKRPFKNHPTHSVLLLLLRWVGAKRKAGRPLMMQPEACRSPRKFQPMPGRPYVFFVCGEVEQRPFSGESFGIFLSLVVS